MNSTPSTIGNSSPDTFSRLRTRLTEELTKSIIPFWEQHSIDKDYGGFFSCLNRDGSIYDTYKQMWMQWREIYMFAALFNSEFRDNRFLKYAQDGADFLFRYGKKADGSYHYLLSRDGKAISDSEGGSEIFSESFAALACAELYAATHNKTYLEESLNALRIYQANTARAEAFNPSYPGNTCTARLAFPMIELNVLITLQKASPESVSDQKIQAVIDKIQSFRHPEKHILLEQKNCDGSFATDTQGGRLVNPGHGLEGIAFILEYEHSHPNQQLTEWCQETARAIFQIGWDSTNGGIRYFVDLEGLPLLPRESMLKAWWPQCEGALAMLRCFESSRNDEFLHIFNMINDYFVKELRDDEFLEYFPYAKTDGIREHQYKGGRFKGFFHIPRYLLKAIEICRRLENGQ